ncbi:hypothetical protein [Bacillus sp. ISL-7]|uniref:hypothetical protein n=1 Tax=Bacillus sp. ISL-7 TaxID=2819136 RepID=UPI001BE781A8|nr:hypothetical protein [Bacillus sp. ISL-7]MBT2736152.1 hypothetical protein [Bacillus sp. ISL-7]
MKEIERLQLENKEHFRAIEEGHKKIEDLTFSEIVIDTKRLVRDAIKQCNEIQFYHEKAINLYDEMLSLCEKLNS